MRRSIRTMSCLGIPNGLHERTRVVGGSLLDGQILGVGRRPMSVLLALYLVCYCDERFTGKTTGIPPRMGFDPSKMAASLSQRLLVPGKLSQLVTVAPQRWT